MNESRTYFFFYASSKSKLESLRDAYKDYDADLNPPEKVDKWCLILKKEIDNAATFDKLDESIFPNAAKKFSVEYDGYERGVVKSTEKVQSDLHLAWKELAKQSLIKKPGIKTVQKLLEAEANYFQSYKQHRDTEIESFILLDSAEKRLSAKMWFEQRKKYNLIALENLKKATRLLREENNNGEVLLLDRIKACDNAIKVLS